MDPDGPDGREVVRFHDENYIINVGKKLDDLCGIPIRKKLFDLLLKVVDGGTKMSAKDSSGEALALEQALGDFEQSKG